MITRMLALGMLFVLCSPLMADESTRIVVSGLPMTFTSPTAADFQAGYVTTTTTGSNVASYTVSITDGHRSRSIVTRIQCGSPCPTIGSSTGIALQDSATVPLEYERAMAAGVGIEKKMIST